MTRKVKLVPTTENKDRIFTTETLRDELNPNFMFQTFHISLLTEIAKGNVNAIELAKQELANRGLDINGNWVGFKR